MGHGYALLPTSEAPTSTMTFRLTPDEKVERDIWILGAVEHGLKISEIAFEVGLSEARVYEIIRKASLISEKSPGRKIKKFKSPRDAAVDEFYRETVCKRCSKDGYASCMHCVGRLNILESEYDASGWPYDWAMYGQEPYIALCS